MDTSQQPIMFTSIACMFIVLGVVIFDGWVQVVMVICGLVMAGAAIAMFAKQQAEKQEKK